MNTKRLLISMYLVLIVLLSTGSALASDISAALFSGTVRATNTGSAAGPDTTTFSSNSTAFKNAFGIDDAWDYFAMLTATGADVAYMPAPPDSDTWGLFIESIGASSSEDYKIYSGNASLSSPKSIILDPEGMNISDNTSLEMVGSGSVEFINTYFATGSEGWAYLKAGAFGIKTGSDNLTANIYDGTPTASSAIRPDAAGDETNLTPSAGANYAAAGDGNDATSVSTTSTSYVRDIYSSANFTDTHDAITSVVIHFKLKTSMWAQNSYGKPVLKINGTVYEGTEQSQADNAAYTEFTQTYTTNPDTGETWTASDINTMQVGITLKATSGHGSYCADVWLIVNYQSDADISASLSTALSAGKYDDLIIAIDSPFVSLDSDYSGSGNITPVSDNLVMNAPLPQVDCSTSPFTTIDGNVLTATVTGATWTEKGYSFDGTNTQNISLSHDAAARPANQVTVIAWVKLNSVINHAGIIGWRVPASNYYHPYTMALDSSGRVNAYAGFTNAVLLNSNTALGTTTWHMTAMTFNSAGYLKYYLDGVLDCTPVAAIGAMDYDLTYNLEIGRNWWAAAYYTLDGTVGDTFIYEKEMSSDELLQIFNATKRKYRDVGSITTISTTTTIPDNDSDIIIGQSAATPYIGAVAVSVNNTAVALWEWEWAAMLTDSISGIVATPSWISAGSDPDVTAAIVKWGPINQAQSTSTGSDSWPQLYTSAPTEPETAYSENTSPGLFFAPPVNALLDMAGIPRSFFWYSFAFFFIIIAGIITYRLHPSLILQFTVMLVLMIFLALPGINVYGMFTTIYFSLFNFGIIVMSRSYGI